MEASHHDWRQEAEEQISGHPYHVCDCDGQFCSCDDAKKIIHLLDELEATEKGLLLRGRMWQEDMRKNKSMVESLQDRLAQIREVAEKLKKDHSESCVKGNYHPCICGASDNNILVKTLKALAGEK